MRRLAWPIAAVAFFIAAVGIWSSLGKAAGLIGAYDANLTAQPSPAAEVAYRFPRAGESFRGPEPAPGSQPIDGSNAAFAHYGNAGQLVIPACDLSAWPFLADDCMITRPRPVQPVAHTVPAEQRPTEQRAVEPAAPATIHTASPPPAATPIPAPAPGPAPVATPAPGPATPARPAAAAPTVAMPLPAGAAPASCGQNLAAATARLEQALAHVKNSRTQNGTEVCATYRRDFFEMVRAREVTALCKTGAERAQDLGRIDLAVEDINGAIAQSCGG